MFNAGTPQGMGAGNVSTPSTVYASSANPSLTDAGNPNSVPGAGLPPTAAPSAPAQPGAAVQGTSPSNFWSQYLTQMYQGG